jgi:hypothetical protein
MAISSPVFSTIHIHPTCDIFISRTVIELGRCFANMFISLYILCTANAACLTSHDLGRAECYRRARLDRIQPS